MTKFTLITTSIDDAFKFAIQKKILSEDSNEYSYYRNWKYLEGNEVRYVFQRFDNPRMHFAVMLKEVA